ncbi:MAG TPA: hypothetical protein DEB06_06425 [Phycisphaerales bacterium]|nr:hypothetical protein [Phycisphaerales bacterium]
MKRRLAEMRVLLMAERRKAGVLGLLLLVLAGALVKSLVSVGPSASEAALPVGATEAEAVAAAGQDAFSRTVAQVDAPRGSSIVRVARAARVDRDLFALDGAHFPPPAQVEDPKSVAQESRVTAIESPAPSVDEDRARTESRVRSAADRLRLRSVIVGQRPIAVFEVKGDRQRAVVRLGESIDGFVLAEVFSDSVVLEMDSVRVRITLVKPDR